LPAVPDVPGVPPAGELATLQHAGLAARLAEAYRLIAGLTAQAQQLTVQARELSARAERLQARVDELERRLGRDSSTSSRPPSSDSPYKKKGRDRSLRQRGKRPPGKQPGDPGTTMRLVDDPDERFWYPPSACGGCGAGLEKALEEQRSEKYRHALIAVVSIGVRAGQLGQDRCLVLVPPGISRMNMSALIQLVTCRNSR
jgi:hypothetical protein